jgi:hypothetical protein
MIGTHKRRFILKSLLPKAYSRCVAAGDSLATFSQVWCDRISKEKAESKS